MELNCYPYIACDESKEWKEKKEKKFTQQYYHPTNWLGYKMFEIELVKIWLLYVKQNKLFRLQPKKKDFIINGTLIWNTKKDENFKNWHFI